MSQPESFFPALGFLIGTLLVILSALPPLKRSSSRLLGLGFLIAFLSIVLAAVFAIFLR